MTPRRYTQLRCGHIVPANDPRPERCVHEWATKRAARNGPRQLALGL